MHRREPGGVHAARPVPRRGRLQSRRRRLLEPSKPDGTACTDGNACTQTDTCQAGTCTGANPVVCTPLDQCHVAGICNPADGVCSNPSQPDGTGCTDGNACTQTDTCQAGTCTAPTRWCARRSTSATSRASAIPPTASARTRPSPTAPRARRQRLHPDRHLPGGHLHRGEPGGRARRSTSATSRASAIPPTASARIRPSPTAPACTDGSACTQTDTCQAGTCTGANPVVCTPLDQCHVAGVCNPADGICSNPSQPNGTACNDGNACTQTDTCQAGTCTGANPVVCTPLDQCHVAGVCNPADGICSNPSQPNGTACTDGNACTQTDTCQAGTCTGANPVVCTPLDQCHVAGVCNPADGICSNPSQPNGTACTDGNACTQTDTCQAGTCTGFNPVICALLDQCHLVGVCDTGTGICSDPVVPDGTPCVDGDACTLSDDCVAGVCGGNAVTCGDGIPQPTCGEPCDDGNTTNGDACDNNCTLTGCGNGVVTGPEDCDDSNALNGDGCSDTCQREFFAPVPAAGDHFGFAVGAFGTNLVVGAPLHDQPSAINTGMVQLFSGSTGALLRTFSNPTANPGDEFGSTVVALGTNLVVAAPLDDTAGLDAGAIYVLNGTTGALIRTIVNPSPGLNDHFGGAIAIMGTNILVGAPQDLDGNGGGGAAYLFHGGTGALLQVFLNPTPAAGDEFGYTIAAVGSEVAVGSPRHDRPAAGFDPEAPDSGEVYIFDVLTGTPIRTLENPAPDPGDLFGRAMVPFGTDVLIGAPVSSAIGASSGAAYLFDGGTGALMQTFASPAPSVSDEFGYAVAAASPDKVVITARRDDTGVFNAGIGYLFHAPTGSLLQSFQKSVPTTEDHFGAAVATTGPRILIGAPLDDNAELDAGAVYSFADLSCGNGGVDPGETCDDGNFLSGDGCDTNCSATACGNGVLTPGEACDDGNLLPGDGCSAQCGLEGLCGDGIQAPFELCDDGNAMSGDGCDANCTPTGCGNSIVTQGETCDRGLLNGTDLCCSISCQAVDADVDGVCDQNDVCPTVPDPLQANGDGDVFGSACDLCPSDTDNDSDADGFCIGTSFNAPAVGSGDPCSQTGAGSEWFKPTIKFGRLGPPLDDDRMRIKGRFFIGSTLPVIAPELHGVHIRVTDSLKNVIVDERIPGGIFSRDTLIGWQKKGELKWIWADRNKPPTYNGITKVVFKDQSRFAPGRMAVFVKAKGGEFHTVTAQTLPVTVSIELNDTALPPGGTPGRDQCGEVAFAPTSCVLSGTNVSCKQQQ